MITEERIKVLEEELTYLREAIQGIGILRFYNLTYFKGRNEGNFIFAVETGLRDAIIVGRNHCTDMGYRFGTVRPALVNLEHRKQLRETNPDFDIDSEEPQHTQARIQRLKEL